MTFFEKWEKEHPGPHVGMGFPPDCPSHYGYEDRPPCDYKHLSCSECWSRDIPEEALEDKKMIYAHIGPFEEKEEPDTIEGKFVEATPIDGKTGMSEAQKLVNSPHILDSGARREFGTGAVRDIQEGKGRCDLLPLDIVAEYLDEATASGQNMVLLRINRFQRTGDIHSLYDALAIFTEQHWDCNHTMLLEVSIHFEEGAKKYGENNWQKGIPVHCYIDSAVRHYLKFLRGDKDEPHDRAFAWNLMCAIWTCKHRPELNDYAQRDTSEVEEALG